MLYLFAFLLALAILPRIQTERRIALTRDEWSTAIAYAVIGVLVGGRLGYVLFYEPLYFVQHPREIFFVWNGGMSSHGGFIGTAVMLIIFCYRNQMNIRRFADLLPVPIFLGFALGRIGNFINEELYGTKTSLPWGIEFTGAEGARHPVQLYDAGISLVLAFVMYVLLRKQNTQPGRVFAIFLMLYGIERILLEVVREQQYSGVDFGFIELTRGQLFTLPLLLLGVLLWIWFRNYSESREQNP